MLSIANKDEQHGYYKKSRSDYYELINNRLKKTIEMIDDTEFNLVLEMINNADTIEVFSVGGIYSSGLELSRKLSRLNFDINTRSDWDELDIVSKRLKKNDLAIFISQTGETEMLVGYQNQIIENQCPCIAIVGTKNSTIGNNSNMVIHWPTLINYIGDADLSSRVPLIFIIDLIIWEKFKVRENFLNKIKNVLLSFLLSYNLGKNKLKDGLSRLKLAYDIVLSE